MGLHQARPADVVNPPDASHFEHLARVHERRARVYVRRRLGLTLRRRVNSDDVLQDILLEATKAFQRGKAPQDLDGGGFFPWLAKLIDNRIKKLARFHVATGRRTVLREVPLDGNEGPARSDGEGRTP